MDNNELHKEIDLIQSCITRMANNSFLLKGWLISIIAVVLALSESTVDPLLLSTILIIPVISFWYLDAFFLRTERMYRQMYIWVLEKRKKDDIELQYDLSPKRFEKSVDSICKTMVSVTLRWFYGIPLLLVIGIALYHLIKILICKE